MACLAWAAPHDDAISWHDREDGDHHVSVGIQANILFRWVRTILRALPFQYNPEYRYKYGVEDPKTGDHKAAWEIRDGDHVKGGYMLYEPDGTKRVVEYESKGKEGFKAVVKRIGHARHPQVYGKHEGKLYKHHRDEHDD